MITVSFPPLTKMFHFSGYGAALCAETPNHKLQETNCKLQDSIIKRLEFLVWLLIFVCILCSWLLEFLCKARLAVVCTAGFPHSDISGSKVATHLPEAYRSYATSFIPFWCQGIRHVPLYRSCWYGSAELHDSLCATENGCALRYSVVKDRARRKKKPLFQAVPANAHKNGW